VQLLAVLPYKLDAGNFGLRFNFKLDAKGITEWVPHPRRVLVFAARVGYPDRSVDAAIED
jgi:hypothetical protein